MPQKSAKSGSKAAVGLKFRPSAPSHSQGGMKPVAEQSSPQHIFSLVIIHLCRKVLFFDTELKIGLYLFLLFVGSTVGDFLPLPKSYFSNKHNVLNQYFVKLGWGWTFTVVGAFMMLTANIYCCGQRPRLQKHVTRLACATMAWYVMTSTFVYIESRFGVCRSKSMPQGRFGTKEMCLDAGFKWSGFDISGHTFLLMFNSLFIMEEAKAICGWEGIKDMIRNEDFARSTSQNKDDVDDTPLQHLTDEDYEKMKANYFKYTGYIKVMFVVLTCFSVLWDVMLVATILYFHTMVQKMSGGIIAILTWFFLYRWLYPQGFACLPGKGAFKYQKSKPRVSQPLRAPSFVFKRKESNSRQAAPKDDIPKFMGMPLYALQNKGNEGGSTQDIDGSK